MVTLSYQKDAYVLDSPESIATLRNSPFHQHTPHAFGNIMSQIAFGGWKFVVLVPVVYILVNQQGRTGREEPE